MVFLKCSIASLKALHQKKIANAADDTDNVDATPATDATAAIDASRSSGYKDLEKYLNPEFEYKLCRRLEASIANKPRTISPARDSFEEDSPLQSSATSDNTTSRAPTSWPDHASSLCHPRPTLHSMIKPQWVQDLIRYGESDEEESLSWPPRLEAVQAPVCKEIIGYEAEEEPLVWPPRPNAAQLECTSGVPEDTEPLPWPPRLNVAVQAAKTENVVAYDDTNEDEPLLGPPRPNATRSEEYCALGPTENDDPLPWPPRLSGAVQPKIENTVAYKDTEADEPLLGPTQLKIPDMTASNKYRPSAMFSGSYRNPWIGVFDPFGDFRESEQHSLLPLGNTKAYQPMTSTISTPSPTYTLDSPVDTPPRTPIPIHAPRPSYPKIAALSTWESQNDFAASIAVNDQTNPPSTPPGLTENAKILLKLLLHG